MNEPDDRTRHRTLKDWLAHLDALSAEERAEAILSLRQKDPARHAQWAPWLDLWDAPQTHQAYAWAPGSGPDAGAGLPALAQGTRLGPWSVDGPLGEGGMGRVMAAHRADGTFERDVAVKLLPAPTLPAVRERLLQEVRLMARLEHPHVVQLLDAGIHEERLIYIVMERVDGVPFTEATRHAPLDQRVRLFLQVLQAVSFLHDHLILHLDIKPDNLLVDSHGRVRLIDFGIACGLSGSTGLPGHEGPTAPDSPPPGADPSRGSGSFTPAYASPEQVTGRALSTRSDVFSLGILLFETLTLRHPFAPLRGADLLSAMVQQDIAWTPAERRRLPKDLRLIIGHAVLKDERLRTSGVRAMHDDLQAWLAHRPISLRRSWTYLAGRQLRRHPGVWLVGLAGLLATTTFAWQQQQAAREATLAREEAVTHLQQVRAFARHVLFDYDPLVRNLPGALPVRERLLQDASRYLDSLKPGSHWPAEWRVEVARAHANLGQTLGQSQHYSELGRPEEAARHLSKAHDWAAPLCTADHEVADACDVVFDVRQRQALQAYTQGDSQAGDRLLEELSRLLAPRINQARPDWLLQLSGLHYIRASQLSNAPALMQAELDESVRLLAKAEAMPTAKPAELLARRVQVLDLRAFAGLQYGRLGPAVQDIQQARTDFERQPPEPGPAVARRVALANLLQTEGELRMAQGQAQAGLPLLARSRQVAEEELAKEPRNASMRAGLGMILWREARALTSSGQPRQALARTRQGLALWPQGIPAHAIPALLNQVNLLREHAHAQARSGDLAAAARTLAQARAQLDSLKHLPPVQARWLTAVGELDGVQAEIHVREGKGQEALRLLEALSQRQQNWLKQHPQDLRTRWELAKALARQLEWAEASGQAVPGLAQRQQLAAARQALIDKGFDAPGDLALWQRLISATPP